MYRLSLLRHGQSTANADGRFTGWVDVPLTREGERHRAGGGKPGRRGHQVVPYWIDVLAPQLRAGALPLVAAHGNSLRALITHWDRLSEREVLSLNMPTGVPLCYEFDARLRPVHRGGRYLDPEAAARVAAVVALEGQTRSDCPEEAVR